MEYRLPFANADVSCKSLPSASPMTNLRLAGARDRRVSTYRDMRDDANGTADRRFRWNTGYLSQTPTNLAKVRLRPLRCRLRESQARAIDGIDVSQHAPVVAAPTSNVAPVPRRTDLVIRRVRINEMMRRGKKNTGMSREYYR